MNSRPQRIPCRAALAFVAGVLTGILAAPLAPAQDQPVASQNAHEPIRWWKGNTHTHTLNSDGDSSPGDVAHWYRDHDYDFLVLSDHNYYTVVDELQMEFDRESERLKKRTFLLIPGEEVTDSFDGAAIHVNGIGTLTLVGAQGGGTKREVLQRSIDAIRAAGGVPSVNHPNFKWSITPRDLAALKRLRHFEIYNGHPGVHNFGGDGYPSLEDMWDDVLSRGVFLYGVAVDDAHNFKAWGPRESNPGKGWIMVRSAKLSKEAIRRAIDGGDFYASTGVLLDSMSAEGRTLSVRITPEEDTKFTTFYVGRGGRVLARETCLDSWYTLQPEDTYVRARVVSSRGEYAWTQFLPQAGIETAAK